jgi:hypothetical protein
MAWSRSLCTKEIRLPAIKITPVFEIIIPDEQSSIF